MQNTIYELIFLFFIYAFLGWCVEVCFQAVTTGKIVNRGFLNGPWCPIYGVGMLGVLLLLKPVMGSLPLLFLFGMLICSLVELMVGWLLEKIFHTRWWDYTDRPFQLGGYICLEFSLMWGLAVTFTVRLIHPAILSFVKLLPHLVGWILIGVLSGAFVADFIVTLVTIVGIRKDLGELQKVAGDLHQISDAISEKLATTTINAGTRLEEKRDVIEQKTVETRARLEETRDAIEQKTEETRARLEERRQQMEQQNVRVHQRLENRVTETLQELQARQKSLELRQTELKKHMFSAPRFRTRRLTNAFPALRKALQERHGEK